MKTLIAIPTYESIEPATFKAIYDLRYDADLEIVKGYGVARARNVIARKALDGGYDRVLMVDSDVVIPSDTLSLFLENPVDICLGVYPHKNTDKNEVELFKLGTHDFEHRFKYSELTERRMEVKGGGFGCAFIKTEVFTKLPYPWFEYVQYQRGALLSEDLFFCNQATKAGYKIITDTAVRCGHICKRELREST